MHQISSCIRRIRSRSSFFSFKLEFSTVPSGAVTRISMTVPSARARPRTAFMKEGNFGWRTLTFGYTRADENDFSIRMFLFGNACCIIHR